MESILIISLGTDQVPILQSLVEINPDKSYLFRKRELTPHQQDILDQIRNKFTSIEVVNTYDFKEVFSKVQEISEQNKKSMIYMDSTTGTKSVLIGFLYYCSFSNPRRTKLVMRDIINLERPYKYSDLKPLPTPAIIGVSQFQKNLLKIMGQEFQTIKELVSRLDLDDELAEKKVNYNINSLEKQNLVASKKEEGRVKAKLTFLGIKYKEKENLTT